MKKIISIIIGILLSSIVFAQDNTDDAIQVVAGQPSLSFWETILSLFNSNKRPLAVLPSGFTCDNTADSSWRFTSTTENMFIGGKCSNTALVKLYSCQNADCSSYTKFGEDYKVNGQNPRFEGVGIGNNYIYFCYDCTGQGGTCQEGKISGTRTCIGANVYYDYQNKDCSKQNDKFIGECTSLPDGTPMVCNSDSSSGTDCIQGQVDTCIWENQQVQKNTYFCATSAPCNSEGYYCDAYDNSKRKRTFMRNDCTPTTTTESCSSGQLCQNGNCVQQTCADFGLQECPNLLNQWADLKCSSDNKRIEGRRCTDMGLKTPCYSSGFNTQSYCSDSDICQDSKCVPRSSLRECTDSDGSDFFSKGAVTTTDEFGQTGTGVDTCDGNILVEWACNIYGQAFTIERDCEKIFRVCKDGACLSRSTACPNLCQEGIEYYDGNPNQAGQCAYSSRTCPKGCEGDHCAGEGLICTPNQCDMINNKVCSDNGLFWTSADYCIKCSEDLECKNTEKCNQCGQGVLNACDVKECHSLGCYASEEDKGFGGIKEDNIINAAYCVAKVPLGKQCDTVNDKLDTKTIHNTCISGYCEKQYIQKGFFEKLFSFGDTKPAYFCAEKPDGYCKMFIWAQYLPLVDGKSACSTGTTLIILMLSGGALAYYRLVYKKPKGGKK